MNLSRRVLRNSYRSSRNLTFYDSENIKADASADDLIALLKKVSGMTEERLRWFQKVENQLRCKEIQVPFSWRPKKFLKNVHDEIHLWELSKIIDTPEFELNMAVGDKPSELLNGVTLIDLVSLLVLYELGLLEKLFEYFPSVAIQKSVLIKLQNLTHPMLGMYSLEKLCLIQEILKAHVSNIIQPGLAAVYECIEEYEETKKILNTNKFIHYSDDGVLRLFIQEEIKEIASCNTFTLIENLEKKEIINVYEAASYVAKLIKLNIKGIPVRLHHFIASMPEDLNKCTTVNDIVDCITSHEISKVLADNVFLYNRNYQEVLKSIGIILSYLINAGTERDAVVAAFWKIWLVKIMFIDKTSTPLTIHMVVSLIYLVNSFDITQEKSIKRAWNALSEIS